MKPAYLFILLLFLPTTAALFHDHLKLDTAVTVSTSDVDWEVLLPSETYLWSHLPDYGEARLDGCWVGCMAKCLFLHTNYCNCEKPDIAKANLVKVEDGVIFSIENAYPSYAAVSHFIFVNRKLPSELDDVVINADGDFRTVFVVFYDTNPHDCRIDSFVAVGYNLTETEEILEKNLKGKVFRKGGWIAFCKPDGDYEVNLTTYLSNRSGLNEESLKGMLETDSFWIYFPPDSNPPQSKSVSYEIRFRFKAFRP